MKIVLFLIILASSLFLGGCAKSLTNEEIIEENKKCKNAGLEAIQNIDSFGETWKVSCLVGSKQ